MRSKYGPIFATILLHTPSATHARVPVAADCATAVWDSCGSLMLLLVTSHHFHAAVLADLPPLCVLLSRKSASQLRAYNHVAIAAGVADPALASAFTA